MKQLSAMDKKRMGKPLTDSPSLMRLKRALLPIILKLAKATVKYRIVSDSKCELVAGKPIIYAVNHSEMSDGPVIANVVVNDCYFLAGKQKLDLGGKLFFWTHGAIYFDRGNKEEMATAKEEICAYLKQGKGIIWAPEATWNLSDSLPMLPMRWGIIQVAREANAQIIPVVLNYDRDSMTCRVDWGKPMHGEMLNDKKTAINALRDCMATFRWRAWECKPMLKRSEIDKMALRARIDAPAKEYGIGDNDEEASYIYRPAPEPAEAFAHLATIEPNSRTAFLFNKRLSGQTGLSQSDIG